MPHVKESLLEIAKTLNKSNIQWALGGSLLLYLKGINTTVGDIDILIDEKDTLKVFSIVKNVHHIEKPKTNIYLTQSFFSITIKDVNIDLMIGFKVKTKSGTYTFPTGKDLVDSVVTINNTKIYLSSVEDWFNAYKAMNRIDKVQLILESGMLTSEEG